jgi:hypothetical protein
MYGIEKPEETWDQVYNQCLINRQLRINGQLPINIQEAIKIESNKASGNETKKYDTPTKHAINKEVRDCVSSFYDTGISFIEKDPLDMIIAVACHVFGFTIDQIKVKSKTPAKAAARAFIYSYTRSNYGKRYSLDLLGEKSNRSPDSVSHSIIAFRGSKCPDYNYKCQVATDIIKDLQNGTKDSK